MLFLHVSDAVFQVEFLGDAGRGVAESFVADGDRQFVILDCGGHFGRDIRHVFGECGRE